MNKILFNWATLLMLLLPLVARADTTPNLETDWLDAVGRGIERFGKANGGEIPSRWEDVVVHNQLEIEARAERFREEFGYEPLQVYGLLQKAVPLPTRPSHLIIMARTKELVMTWKNSEGRRESYTYIRVLFRDEDGKVRSTTGAEVDLTSMKSTLEALKPLKFANSDVAGSSAVNSGASEKDAGMRTDVESGDLGETDAERMRNAGMTADIVPSGHLSYPAVGIISFLSAAVGATMIWALRRGGTTGR